MIMMGSIPIPNTRFYLTSIDGKKWFITEYYRTAPFNPAKETYDLYKAFTEAFRENEREEQGFSEELKEAVKKEKLQEQLREFLVNATGDPKYAEYELKLCAEYIKE